MTTFRKIVDIIPAQETADGDGVKLRRSLGGEGLRHDPFLLFDEIMSDDAADYIGGFPPHPHRGFETVTYMLEGKMQHKDHMGNVGLLQPGGAQWMTAGKGVIHEEMPQQDHGRLHGFQLWLNLPASEKMKPAAYQDIEPQQIPTVAAEGSRLRLIAGRLEWQGQKLVGPINGQAGERSTDPLMADIELARGANIDLALNPEHNAFIYVFDGEITVRESTVTAPAAARLSLAQALRLSSTGGGRVLLLAGKPLQEPVAQRGPFVMNTQEEIYQAMRDYGNGQLTE